MKYIFIYCLLFAACTNTPTENADCSDVKPQNTADPQAKQSTANRFSTLGNEANRPHVAKDGLWKLIGFDSSGMDAGQMNWLRRELQFPRVWSDYMNDEDKESMVLYRVRNETPKGVFKNSYNHDIYGKIIDVDLQYSDMTIGVTESSGVLYIRCLLAGEKFAFYTTDFPVTPPVGHVEMSALILEHFNKAKKTNK
jgi:hypothetical protein